MMFDVLNGQPDLMNVDEAALLLNCRPQTVARLCRQGKLHAMKIGKSWTIPKFSLNDFILKKTNYQSGVGFD